jgi:pimeloyl-ACP methyl ester carboxylesterase
VDIARITRRIDVNGVRLRVAEEGAGAPVLLLHGFPDSLELWRHQWGPLVGAGYRVIAYDQRGFGESNAPAGREAYSLDTIVADAVGVLEVLGVREKVLLVGHDWGAVVGWVLAGRWPERVERFVAVSVGHPEAYASAGLGQKVKGWYVGLFQVRGLAEWVLSPRDFVVFRRQIGRRSEAERWVRDLSRPGRLTAGLNWYRANFGALARPAFPRVRVPVMGVWSTGDVALTERQMIGSRKYVEGPWRYERIEGVSHWIPTEAAERFNSLLLAYFAGRAD